jgi:hypothetical protein
MGACRSTTSPGARRDRVDHGESRPRKKSGNRSSLAEIMAGRDPHCRRKCRGPRGRHRLPTSSTSTSELRRGGSLRDPVTVKGRLKAHQAALGDLPVTRSENRTTSFVFTAAYRKGREIARSTERWPHCGRRSTGAAPGPAVLGHHPFHRFGVHIRVKDETKRDRRIGLQEEQALLAACSEMNDAEHKCVGARCTIASSARSRRAVARARCCDQCRHVDWEHHQIAILENMRRTATTADPVRSAGTSRADSQAACGARSSGFVFGRR